jgi:phosphate transport system substrate-binding protein
MNKATLALTAAMLVSCGGSGEPAVQNITGTGATFPFPMYSKWFDEFRTVYPNVQINYQSLGSGAGVNQVTEGTVDFGASDQPLTAEQMSAFEAKRGTKILHFPTVLGAVVPTYHLPGVTVELNFTPAALAGIFLGKITKWNDPAIASVNVGIALPASEIVVVHRSDGSGTTYIWTDYLSKVSPEWKNGPGQGTSISWPVGLGGRGNEGVAGLIKQTPNSIGYVELIYAVQNTMSTGLVQNSAGNFIRPALASVTAAAAGTEMPDDFRVSITNPEGGNAYPIASFTWLLIPERIEDESKRNTIHDFIEWMLTTGQTMTTALEYAPLPEAVVAKEQALLAMLR